MFKDLTYKELKKVFNGEYRTIENYWRTIKVGLDSYRKVSCPKTYFKLGQMGEYLEYSRLLTTTTVCQERHITLYSFDKIIIIDHDGTIHNIKTLVEWKQYFHKNEDIVEVDIPIFTIDSY
tara:strand:+ start:958 stop:1320 length:363 start_codon:yes stop_codon:yes gene_type:complete